MYGQCCRHHASVQPLSSTVGSTIRACAIEGTYISSRGQTMAANEPYTRTVEVTDGRFTYSAAKSENGPNCDATNYIMLEKVADATLPDLWLPVQPRRSAWWQLRLDDVVPIGLVHVQPPGLTDYESNERNRDCRSRFLFHGTDKCPRDRESGVRSLKSAPGTSPCLKVFRLLHPHCCF